jgi:hypothetical protein
VAALRPRARIVQRNVERARAAGTLARPNSSNARSLEQVIRKSRTNERATFAQRASAPVTSLQHAICFP